MDARAVSLQEDYDRFAWRVSDAVVGWTVASLATLGLVVFCALALNDWAVDHIRALFG